jgi:AhpD family alkylhydroperoxidase
VARCTEPNRDPMIRHVTPTGRRAASGATATVYERMAREFGIHGEPITLHSPVPDLLAGAWNLLREHLIARGVVERPVKEAVAATVSSINRCPYCVDAHAAMLAASGDLAAARRIDDGDYRSIDDEQLAPAVEWAAATRSPGAQVLRDPPFGERERPEMVGTAVMFHYINRPVSVFLDASPLPAGGRVLKRRMLWVAGRRFRRFALTAPQPGANLELLVDAQLPPDMGWADGSDPIRRAWAGFAAAVERYGARALPQSVRELVAARVGEWDGADPGLGLDWLEQALDGLGEPDLAAARLSLMVALAPYRVDDELIARFLDSPAPDSLSPDARLVATVSWSALAAARRVGSWL